MSTTREAGRAGLSIAVAVCVTAVVAATSGTDDAAGFGAVYLVELALTVDTALALHLLVHHLGVDPEARARVVRWALAAPVALRLALLPAGAAALEHADWIAYPAGASLLAAALVLARSNPPTRPEPGATWQPLLLRVAGRLTGSVVPATTVATGAAVAVAAVLALDGAIAAWTIPDHAVAVVAATVLATVGIADLYRLTERHLARHLHLRAAVVLLLLFAAARILSAGPSDPRLGPAVAAVAVAVAVGAIAAAFARHAPTEEVDHARR